MINDYLSETEYFALTGVDPSDISSAYLTELINSFNEMINDELCGIFSFVQDTIRFYESNDRSLITIGNWQPAGVVNSITVTNGGNGYDATTTATLDSGSATLTPIVVEGVVTRIDIKRQGSGYTTAPIVTIGGIGSSATATATISTISLAIGEDGDNAVTEAIVEGDDYRFDVIPSQNRATVNPYQRVLLYCRNVMNRRYLEITGTMGYAPSIPAKFNLKGQLYDLVTDVLYSTDNKNISGGAGTIDGAKIGDVSANYGSSSGSTNSSSSKSPSDALDIAQGILEGIANEYGQPLALASTII